MTSVPDVGGTAGEARELPEATKLRPDRLAASVALHVAAVVALASIGVAFLPAPPAETPLNVEVIGAQEFDAMRQFPAPPTQAPGNAGEPVSASRPVPAQSAPTARQDDMVRPSQMLSEQALRAPRNRPLQRQLASLADDEHIAQLCDLEAMEQVHLWKSAFQPDRLVDYALSDPHMEDATFVAKGGAFRSGHRWYEISFRCELDAGRRKVVGFAFRVGDPIPTSEWSALNLPALH